MKTNKPVNPRHLFFFFLLFFFVKNKKYNKNKMLSYDPLLDLTTGRNYFITLSNIKMFKKKNNDN